MSDRPRSHRIIVFALAGLALAHAWGIMALISASDPWYRNTDMNVHNMVDALAINSGIAPNEMAQPAVPLKFLLALDYRIRHELGLLRVWNMRRLDAAPDPLREIPQLIRIGRVQSRILVLVLILCAAGLVHAVTRDPDAAALAVILLAGSPGLLFQGLLTRPELLCVGFGNVLALWAVWRATSGRRGHARQAWLLASGLLGGLAALEKLPGVCFLALAFAWCCASALLARDHEADESDPPALWYAGCLLPLACGLAILGLLVALAPQHDALGPVVVARLRLAGAGIALLPFLTLAGGRSRPARFVQQRIRELALLGGGALLALLGGYLALRTVMPAGAAATYYASVLHFLVNPAPYMTTFLADTPAVGRGTLVFFREAPLIVVGSAVAAGAAVALRGTPARLKAFIILLVSGAALLTLLMSRRFFADQYSIFPQVPLLIVTALGFHAFSLRWRARGAAVAPPWPVPLALTIACIVIFSAYFQLQPKYAYYQDDALLPTNELTRTFLFDHDAHAPAYRELMQRHYGDRRKFVDHLEHFLADPAHRR